MKSKPYSLLQSIIGKLPQVKKLSKINLFDCIVLASRVHNQLMNLF